VGIAKVLAVLALLFAVLALVPFPDPWGARAPTWLLAIAVLFLAIIAFTGGGP
jgi:hypothetical protein